MFKGGKRKRHGQKKSAAISDITVQDFADALPSQRPGLRGKKGDNSIIIHKKGIPEMADEAKGVSWFDKNLDDFDITVGGDGEGDDEEELVTKERSLGQKKSASSRKHRQVPCEDHGVIYPVDLWYQLGRYILPESVATFARLCRGANCIVQSVQFWRHMHTRYYQDSDHLPESLGPESLDCIHGLRARVIKMLHCVYLPLSSRTKTTVPFENEPHGFLGHRCVMAWHKKVKNVWNFYFKFRKGDLIDTSSNESKSLRSRDFLKWHQDLYFNPDNHCAVLEVTCSNFVRVPIVMGLLVNQVYLNVSPTSMRYHRLKVVFDTSYRTTTAKTQSGMVELVLDPVLELRVYPWWFPQYDESHSIIEADEP